MNKLSEILFEIKTCTDSAMQYSTEKDVKHVKGS